MAHEATIRNLDQEQSRIKEKISRLEDERELLLSQSQSASEQHKQQVLKLEQVHFLYASFVPAHCESYKAISPPIYIFSSVSA